MSGHIIINRSKHNNLIRCVSILAVILVLILLATLIIHGFNYQVNSNKNITNNVKLRSKRDIRLSKRSKNILAHDPRNMYILAYNDSGDNIEHFSDTNSECGVLYEPSDKLKELEMLCKSDEGEGFFYDSF